MNQKVIRIATRKSPLALWQANHVKALLAKQWPNYAFELVPMTTSGDNILKNKLQAFGGKGLFVKELEEALLDKRACLAVHSTKDMPATFPKGLTLSALCKRDNPFDAFISPQFKTLEALPQGAVVGTASLRRQSQLLALRPDIQIKPLRGNINTRLAKLDDGLYHAIILAAAGLERMNLTHHATELLSEEQMLPACGQGAICIESRTDDEEINTIVSKINDPITSLCVQTERLVNAKLGGNCHVPLAVYCTVTQAQQLHLRAKVLALDGSLCLYDSQTGTLEESSLLAEHCTKALLDKGAKALLDASHS